jgi:hypothetical protein
MRKSYRNKYYWQEDTVDKEDGDLQLAIDKLNETKRLIKPRNKNHNYFKLEEQKRKIC